MLTCTPDAEMETQHFNLALSHSGDESRRDVEEKREEVEGKEAGREEEEDAPAHAA